MDGWSLVRSKSRILLQLSRSRGLPRAIPGLPQKQLPRSRVASHAQAGFTIQASKLRLDSPAEEIQ